MSEGPFSKKLSGQISGEEKLTRNNDNDVNCWRSIGILFNHDLRFYREELQKLQLA